MTRETYDPETLIGKDVFDAKLKKIGKISAIAISLIVGNESIPIEKIVQIGDIVQLKDETETETHQNVRTPALMANRKAGKVCPKCGRMNGNWAKFCFQCAYKL